MEGKPKGCQHMYPTPVAHRSCLPIGVSHGVHRGPHAEQTEPLTSRLRLHEICGSSKGRGLNLNVARWRR
jgi:hypothetical protein